jgi:hypothetical protein
MIRRHPLFFSISTSLLATWPTVAAESEPGSDPVLMGLTSTGPTIFISAVAIALLLTVVFHASARHIARFTTEVKGRRRMNEILSDASPAVIEDLILPGAYGGLTCIDNVIMTSGGLFSIQTKQYNGTIIGATDEPQWTNVDGIYRHNFLNPLIQNEGRTRSLQKVIPGVPVSNLVVFTGEIQFAAELAENVIHIDELRRYIAQYEFGPSKIKDWNAVWHSIKAAALTDEASRKDFLAQLSFS